jgi:type II secretory pathway pseudopilin PulG
MNKNSRAFSLVELAVVVLIVGLMGTMIGMGIRMHRNAGLTARTRMQFIQYESALKAYCREYGEMPPFIGAEELCWLNRDGNSELLIKSLSGRNPDGSQLSQRDKNYLNPLGKRFFTFTGTDFFQRSDGSLDHSQIADAFNNTNICIILESAYDNDTTIPKSSLPEVIQKQIIGDLIHAQIAIFSVDENYKSAIGNWTD